MTVRIVYFENISAEARALIESLKHPGFELTHWTDVPAAQQSACLAAADYFITSAHVIARDMMEQAPRVRLIQRNGIGIDNIDVAAADELGIMVANTPGVNASTVAELTIAMILCLYRKLIFLDQATKSGKWLMWDYRTSMFEMKGKTHGIIGMGSIGREVAKVSQAFGTKVIYTNRTRLAPEQERQKELTYVSLRELLSTADIVSLHIPLVPETRHLISTAEFNLMKPTAVLINVARGGVVDENALDDALRRKQILGAGMDTWAVEPVESGHPLLKYDNVIATPHIGGGSRDTLLATFKLAFQNIARVEAGLPPNHLVGKVATAKLRQPIPPGRRCTGCSRGDQGMP